MDELFTSFSKETTEEIIRWVKNCEVFQCYDDLEMEYEKEQVLIELEKLLKQKLSIMDIFKIHMIEVYDDEAHEFDKIAKLCLKLYMDSIIQRNREVHKSMRNKDSFFDERFEFTKNEIIRFINGEIPVFPTEAVKCLYLLTDGDIEPNRQGVTALQLLKQCVPYCKTDEQCTVINTAIWSAVL